MTPILRNILALIAGWLVGSLVNMGLVQLGYSVIPIEGVDTSDMDALAAAMPGLQFKHFIFPFLAHALGSFTGALLTVVIAVKHKMKLALGVGAVFFLGGIWASTMLPAPTWFIIADLVLAYFPMAWLGATLVTRKQ